jgi:uncharacterized protein (TIGR03382 family)
MMSTIGLSAPFDAPATLIALALLLAWLRRNEYQPAS